MTAPAVLLAISGVAAVIALLLSVVARGRLSRGLALWSLWLALAAIPASIAWDFVVPPPPEANHSVPPDTLALAITHVKSYGTLVMPFAGIAMIALRRAGASARRSGRR